MAEQIVLIQPEGGADAVSLNAAFGLVGASTTDQWKLRYNSATSDTTNATNSTTLGVGGTVQVEVAEAFKPDGVFEAGANLTVASGVALTNSQTCTVVDLEITFDGTANSYLILDGSMSGKTATFKRCLLRKISTSFSTAIIGANNGTWNFYNCGVDVDSSGAAVNVNGIQKFSSATYNCYNTTVLKNSAASQAGSGFHTCNVQNCIGVNDGGGTNGDGAFTSCTAIGGGYNLQTYNVAAPGTTEWHNITGATLLKTVTAGSVDLRAKDYGTMASYIGTDASGTIGDSLTLENNTRLSGWADAMVGASYQYPAAPTVDATPAPNASYTVGDSYSVDHAATGTGTLTFDGPMAGALPSGTTLTGATGVVAGTLDTAEAVAYTLRVTDAWGQTGTREFTTTINAPASTAPVAGFEAGSGPLGNGLRGMEL